MNKIKLEFPFDPFEGEHLPLKIEMKLGSPVMLSYPWIMFDSIIADSVIKTYFPSVFDSIGRKAVVDLSNLSIPIQKYPFQSNGSKDFFYHASCSRFSESIQRTTNIRKKLCPEDTVYTDTKKRVSTDRGMFKSYDMRMITISAKTCTFFCSGNKKEIETLLKGFVCLGKKRVVGFGRVMNINVQTLDEDMSISHPDYGLNRPVPVVTPMIIDPHHPVAYLAYRFPYWDKSMHTSCYVPNGF